MTGTMTAEQLTPNTRITVCADFVIDIYAVENGVIRYGCNYGDIYDGEPLRLNLPKFLQILNGAPYTIETLSNPPVPKSP